MGTVGLVYRYLRLAGLITQTILGPSDLLD